MDGIERLVGRLKGTIIPIRTPHDLAGVIRRVDQRIAKARGLNFDIPCP
jgi:hypothetical protein